MPVCDLPLLSLLAGFSSLLLPFSNEDSDTLMPNTLVNLEKRQVLSFGEHHPHAVPQAGRVKPLYF